MARNRAHRAASVKCSLPVVSIDNPNKPGVRVLILLFHIEVGFGFNKYTGS